MGQLVKVLLILSAFLLNACSTSEPRAPVEHNTVNLKLPKKDSADLCKYTSKKGIAELVDKKNSHYSFVFFPGNIRFALEYKSSLPESVQPGSEFRATYDELVSGGEECISPQPIIVDLPH